VKVEGSQHHDTAAAIVEFGFIFVPIVLFSWLNRADRKGSS